MFNNIWCFIDSPFKKRIKTHRKMKNKYQNLTGHIVSSVRAKIVIFHLILIPLET